jgi:hypothetical protein
MAAVVVAAAAGVAAAAEAATAGAGVAAGAAEAAATAEAMVEAMVAALVMLAAVGAAATAEAMVGAMVAVAITAQWRAVTAAAMAITAQWRAVTAAAMAITAQWRGMTAAALLGPGEVDRGSQKAARVAVSSMVIVIDSLSVTTVGIGSSIAGSRTEATTLTASIIGTGYLGTVSGSGSTAPITTPTTIAGGYADRPSLRGARIGGAAITTASAIIKLTSAQERPREGGAFFLRLNRIGAVALAAQRADNNQGVGKQSASLSSAYTIHPSSRALSFAACHARASSSWSSVSERRRKMSWG